MLHIVGYVKINIEAKMEFALLVFKDVEIAQTEQLVQTVYHNM